MPLNVVYVWYITTVPGTVKQGSRRATISFDVEIQPTVDPFVSCRAPLPELLEHTESRAVPLLLLIPGVWRVWRVMGQRVPGSGVLHCAYSEAWHTTHSSSSSSSSSST